jgi:hypothetical protein
VIGHQLLELLVYWCMAARIGQMRQRIGLTASPDRRSLGSPLTLPACIRFLTGTQFQIKFYRCRHRITAVPVQTIVASHIQLTNVVAASFTVQCAVSLAALRQIAACAKKKYAAIIGITNSHDVAISRFQGSTVRYKTAKITEIEINVNWISAGTKMKVLAREQCPRISCPELFDMPDKYQVWNLRCLEFTVIEFTPV